MSTEGDVNKDFPSLELLYDHVKDVLNQESNILANLSQKATFLWGAISAILGIVISLISLNHPIDIFKNGLFIWILGLYGVTTIMAGIIVFPKYWSDIPDFYALWSEFSSSTKENFWYHMYANIQEASSRNEHRLLIDALLIRLMSFGVLAQLILIILCVRSISV